MHCGYSEVQLDETGDDAVQLGRVGNADKGFPEEVTLKLRLEYVEISQVNDISGKGNCSVEVFRQAGNCPIRGMERSLPGCKVR